LNFLPSIAIKSLESFFVSFLGGVFIFEQRVNQLKVYPNPAKDYIIVEYTLNSNSDDVSIDLYDISGKRIRSIKVDNTHDWLVVPLTDLPGGNYFGVINSDMKIDGTVKFVITK